jgi:hypothetical protein
VSAENTVDAKVVKISALAITAGDITGVDANKKADCATKLSTAVFAPSTVFLAPGAQNVLLTLKGAVKLDETTTVDCEGMSFKTKWTVEFAPQRNAPGVLGTGGSADVPAT